MRKTIKATGIIFILLTLILCLIIGFYYVILPDNFCISKGSSLNLETAVPIKAVSIAKTVPVFSDRTSSCNAQLMLFGAFPIKNVKVTENERPYLTPCGTPFGIKILTDGVVVTDFGYVDGERQRCPASECGIKTGDIIKTVNGAEISSSNDIASAVELNPVRTVIEAEREGKKLTFTAYPEKSSKDGSYKLGMWTRDSCAGIGTVTYYDEKSGTYGGLGHGVCDIDTGVLLPVSKGTIVNVSISSIIKGTSGNPGELSGTFLSKSASGNIMINSECGVFGRMDYAPVISAAMPMGYKQETETGKATILTTINGTEPKEYDIVIEKINYNSSKAVKNMVIRITDPELLSKSGGIVQGMSGSPIIQNGMLVGAVTHVFVNDTTRGYAIFAENMYSCQTGINGQSFEISAA